MSTKARGCCPKCGSVLSTVTWDCRACDWTADRQCCGNCRWARSDREDQSLKPKSPPGLICARNGDAVRARDVWSCFEDGGV
jgi:hypothetical protein